LKPAFGPPEEAVRADQTFLCVARNLEDWIPTRPHLEVPLSRSRNSLGILGLLTMQ
jgi:hypothetical protein